MSRESYVWRDGKLIPKHLAPPLVQRFGSGPSIIGDIGEVQSQIDGKVYSSRRHYNDHLRAHGCRVVGNDWNNQPQKNEPTGIDTNVRPALEQAYAELKSR